MVYIDYSVENVNIYKFCQRHKQQMCTFEGLVFLFGNLDSHCFQFQNNFN